MALYMELAITEPVQLAKLATLEPADARSFDSLRARLFQMMIEWKGPTHRGLPRARVERIAQILGYPPQSEVFKAMVEVCEALAAGMTANAQEQINWNQYLRRAEPLFVHFAGIRLKELEPNRVLEPLPL
jgi:hypothetical protein